MPQEQQPKTTQQVINSIYFGQLKCLHNFSIDFEPHAVTAILGPNGSGKSTILHALASVYQPKDAGENRKFNDFFPRSPDAEWNGSNLVITHSYRRGTETKNKEEESFGKADENGSRWTKIYARRPFREIYYIGIESCVPMIESEKVKGSSKINYVTTVLEGVQANNLLEKASEVLNKRYIKINENKLSNGKKLIGVQAEGVTYSAYSMSAGEQKVFFILDRVFSAGKYSLILIDEIDLLLHDRALKNLIKIINDRAIEKDLQIIFTTHREMIISLSEIVNIRHVVSVDGKTLCFSETKPDAINRLTGDSVKRIEVFVEDDFAEGIIQNAAGKMKANKFVSVSTYGAAINAFTILSGLLLKGELCDDFCVVLDGDEYRTPASKTERINKSLTGEDEKAKRLRGVARNKVLQFNLPEGHNPESYVHYLLCSDLIQDLKDEEAEIIEAAKKIKYVKDGHKYIDQVIDELGINRAVALNNIISLVSKHPEWNDFITSIVDWMTPRVEALKEK